MTNLVKPNKILSNLIKPCLIKPSLIKRYAAVAALLVFFSSVISCTTSTAIGPDQSAIVKSDNDKRLYKFVELHNKLRVLLVSDPNTDKAAASLDVYVGSGNDPQNYQGLAHFLEHMLFLGTEKFPEAGAYQAFINQHNGSHNAYTSFEHTNYFFDIEPAHLGSALDRFSQFFVAPLFTEAYVEREKNAVHSEYMAKIKTDQRKSLEVFKSVINPKHPFSKFSVGNLDTLSKKDDQQHSLRDQLVTFYNEHYSANVMTLVVLGRESVGELEAMVSARFAEIPNTSKKINSIEEPLFSEGVLPLNLTIKPEKTQRILSLSFPTEEEVPFYRQKPLHYLGNIIGHEGQGSLLSHLKSKGLAEALGAGSGLSYKGGGNFTITIELTEKGLQHTDQVITAVFQTINRIKKSGATPWLFEEQSALAAQQFRYIEQSSPINYVSGLATNLQYYPAAQVLSGSYLMSEFDSQLINRFLNYLSPENTLITLSAPGVAVDTTSHFYKAQYQSKPVSADALSRWMNAGLNPEITLPKANEFIAGDLALNSRTQVQAKPILISEQEGMRVWFKQDDRFNLPKGSVFLSVRSPVASDTIKHSVLLSMFTRMIDDQLNEFSYPAILAGLDYSIKEHHRGFSVKVHGFNDKQTLLLDKIIHALTALDFDTQRFANIKQDHIRRLENSSKQQPYRLLMRQLPQLLYRGKWSDEQLLTVYRSITLQDLKEFSLQLLSNVNINMLVHGNYSERQARLLGEQASKALLKNAVPTTEVSVGKINRGESAFRMRSEYSDASLLFYIQASDLKKSTRAAMGVTAHWLRSDFYTQLRTEKQLGYVVTAGAYPIIDVPGIIFMVQSPVAGPSTLQKEINLFIEQKQKEIASLSPSVFEQHRQALIQRLSESPKNIWEQSGRYWQNIVQNYSEFDSREQLIEALEALTFEQWRAFFGQQISASKRQGLWVFSDGQFKDQALKEVDVIQEITAFKSQATYYQFQ
jgi:insulysin